MGKRPSGSRGKPGHRAGGADSAAGSTSARAAARAASDSPESGEGAQTANPRRSESTRASRIRIMPRTVARARNTPYVMPQAAAGATQPERQQTPDRRAKFK